MNYVYIFIIIALLVVGGFFALKHYFAINRRVKSLKDGAISTFDKVKNGK